MRYNDHGHAGPGHRIQDLQHLLGTLGIERSSRLIEQNNIGLECQCAGNTHEQCLCALEELRTAEAMLDSGQRDVSGRFQVSMPVLFGRRFIAPPLIALTKEHPKLELELDLNFNDRRVDLIEDGFDLARQDARRRAWAGPPQSRPTNMSAAN
jgi:DNA-binding transcriptional LysR family regulator